MSWDGKMYDKYRIAHTDGTPLKGKKYFVLRLDSDDPVEAARVAAAMRAYKSEPRMEARMAETHDTIKGLLAEFRGYAAGMPDSYHVTMSWADFRKMLTRFEWAHDHDIATATEACARAVVGACVKQQEAERKCVALREALDEAENGLFRWQSGSMNRDEHRKLIAMIKTALAATEKEGGAK